jgi:rhodanese-related sulfurtransferase
VATDQPAVLFVDTSKEFAAGHIAGSRWLLRSWLDLDASIAAGDKRAPILITDTDGRNAALAAAALTELGYECVFVLEGGLKAWTAAGLPVEQGLSGVLVPPQDVVPTGGDRPCHEMINYLRWEETLGHAVHPQQTSV